MSSTSSLSTSESSHDALMTSTIKSSSKAQLQPTPQAPSQAKKRLQNMALIDHKLMAACTAVLLMYIMVTLGAWIHLEQLDGEHGSHNHVISSVAAQHIVATTAHITQGGDPLRYQEIVDIATLQHTFPVHVRDDMEEIYHPGMFLANQYQMAQVVRSRPYELPQNGRVRVPKFWDPSAYGPEGVRQFLGDYGNRLITPEEASQIGSFVTVQNDVQLETIYISVASYRDPECQLTVEDMFLRAEYPERMRVAIIDQRAVDDPVPPCAQPVVPCSQDPEQALCRYRHLIESYEVPAQLSIGPVYARHLAHRMYRGEYFAMQVDSHVRFIEHWDSNIIQQWKSAENEMAVLSVYLSDLNGSLDPVTHESKHPSRPIMCKTDYEGGGKMKHLRHGQQPEGIPGIHGEPTLHPFWAAGFSFARGHFVVQVPYDQYQPMVFQGEEISMGLRGFTYGYDYYTPEFSVAFHMYAIKANAAKRSKIKKFWENQNFYPGSAVEGMKRLNGIIGMGDSEDEYYDGEEEEYGLGKVRTKELFFELYGIHTDTQTVEDHLCRFVGKPMQRKFIPHLRKNRMGIDFDQFRFRFHDPAPSEGSPDEKESESASK